jgi:hypothetical protein
VSGTRQAGVNFGPASVTTWNFQAESVSAGPVSLEPDQKLDLQPGTYSSLNVKSRSTVVLHTGVYLFTGSITLEPQSVLSIDSANGPVQVYLQGNLTYRGSIRSATIGIPQLLVGKLGTGSLMLEASFTGALIAPQADIALQAARPGGHRAIIYGRSVRAEPDTMIRAYPFDWGGIAPTLEPPFDPTIPKHKMPQSPLDMPVVVNGGTGTTGAGDTTVAPPAPVTFTLPESYPVSGGIIANGCATFTFQTPASQTVVCTYCGGSSTSTPNTAEELNRGRTVHFQGCADGLPPSQPRTGVSFRLHVDPVPDYPVTVNSPAIRDGGCSEDLELLSPEQTTEMRESFAWTLARVLDTKPETNPDGTPALYYGWIFIRNKTDALNLRKLFIHVLRRPLFQQELDQFKGRCGTFTNPGNGDGTFVPVLIPGATYNLLIRLLSDIMIFPFPQLPVEGDREIFEAVILRDDVPPAARNPNGSVRIDVLAQANFRYLGYEQHPLPASGDIQLDSDDVARALVGAVAWAAQAARDIAEVVTNLLGALDCTIRNCIQLTLHVHAETKDYAFASTVSGDPTMIRAWGSRRGQHLGAPAMEITITQEFLDLPIPSTFQASTNHSGKVVVDAVQGGDVRGSGLCIQLQNDAALITDFLISTELCDFRGLNLDFSRSNEMQLQIYSPRLMGMYQADDAFQWSKDVVGFTPPRARIVSGWTANTFTTDSDPDGDGPLGEENRLYAPCLTFGTTVNDALLDASLAFGRLATIFGAGLPAAYGVADDIVIGFVNVAKNTDIMMSTESRLPNSRLVMSHEYGHYIFCAMLEDDDFGEPGAVDAIVENVIATGEDLSDPLRYTNEAFADFVAGQVAGGANYDWVRRAFNSDDSHAPPVPIRENYCVRLNLNQLNPPFPGELPCFDDNMRSAPDAIDNPAGVGRIATLLHDLFDGHPNSLGRNVPGDADLFDHVGPPGNIFGQPLVLNFTSYGSTDAALERVALPGAALKSFAGSIASELA